MAGTVSKLKMATITGVIIALVAITLAGCGSLAGQGDQVDAYPPGSVIPHTITVTGYGEASVAPDVAYVMLGVNTTGPDAESAANQNNRRMQAVMDALREQGLEDSDIQTLGFNVWPEDRFDPQTGLPTGERIYHVDNTLQVKVTDLDKVANIIQGGLDAGANNILSLTFTVQDPAAALDEARQKAIEDARQRAQEIAEGLGATLGEPLVISEGGGYYPPIYPGAYPTPYPPYYPGMGGGGGVPPIVPGQTIISTTIFVIFTLE